MSDKIMYREASLSAAASELDKLADALSDVMRQLDAVDTSAQWWSKVKGAGCDGSALDTLRALRTKSAAVGSESSDLADGVRRTIELFEEAEARANGLYDESAGGDVPYGQQGAQGESNAQFFNSLLSAMMLSGMLAPGLASWELLMLLTGMNPMQMLDQGLNLYDAASNVYGMYSAFSSWTASTGFSDLFGDLVGKGGAGECAAAWGGMVLSTINAWMGNKQEQAETGMSEARVWLETFTEVAVDTAMVNGIAYLVGEAAVAVGVTVSSSAVVLTLGAAAIYFGIDLAVEHFTGSSMTEHITDAIIDTAETVCEKVGDCVNAVTNTVANWFTSVSNAFA